MIIEYHITKDRCWKTIHILFCVSVNLFRKIFINNINYKYMHFQEVVSYLQMESSYTDISYDFSDGLQHYINNILS